VHGFLHELDQAFLTPDFGQGPLDFQVDTAFLGTLLVGEDLRFVRDFAQKKWPLRGSRECRLQMDNCKMHIANCPPSTADGPDQVDSDNSQFAVFNLQFPMAGTSTENCRCAYLTAYSKAVEAGTLQANLAAEQSYEFPRYEVVLGQTIQTFILIGPGKECLLGTALLAPHRLEIDYEAGTVRLIQGASW
jgi:hypothetical protein